MPLGTLPEAQTFVSQPRHTLSLQPFLPNTHPTFLLGCLWDPWNSTGSRPNSGPSLPSPWFSSGVPYVHGLENVHFIYWHGSQLNYRGRSTGVLFEGVRIKWEGGMEARRIMNFCKMWWGGEVLVAEGRSAEGGFFLLLLRWEKLQHV